MSAIDLCWITRRNPNIKKYVFCSLSKPLKLTTRRRVAFPNCKVLGEKMCCLRYQTFWIEGGREELSGRSMFFRCVFESLCPPLTPLSLLSPTHKLRCKFFISAILLGGSADLLIVLHQKIVWNHYVCINK